MLIGAHVGVSGGYANAVEYAVSVGAECMQVFAKSPRQWVTRPIPQQAVTSFRARVAELGVGPVLVHTSYLINLGSRDPALWEKSIVALADELVRAEALGAGAVVTHVGTRFSAAPDRAGSRIAAAVDGAWVASGVSRTRLLLENTAGAGSTFGSGPEELGEIVRHLDPSARSVGVCLDTCHAHAAGWDLASGEGWRQLLDGFESLCGARVEAVHANDCLFGCGLRRDRHAWIGDGTIGYDGFALMMAEPRLSGLPVIVEMPGEVPAKDVENITRLKRLRDASSGPA